MPAYNSNDLYSSLVQQQASASFRDECIGEKSYRKILQSHPDKLYTPNYFIRIALGLLTIIAVLFVTVLLVLLSSTSQSNQFVTLCIFLGIACYAALELLLKRKKFYNAGVDNILMASVIIFIISSFFVSSSTTNYILISGTSMILCLYLCMRFADAFMASISYLSFFVFIFLLYIKMGSIAKITAPFLMLATSAITHSIMKNLEKKDRLIIYNFCIKSVKFLTLITFYASANYFVVKELSTQMFGLQLTIHDGIPLGWLFWILTFTIPVIYIFYGIKGKDFLFIRTGLGLIATTIFTIRYYHNIFPLEISMFIAGTITIAISYSLMQYLKTPKRGYTSTDLHPGNTNLLNAEALIIIQTFGTSSKTENNTLFGGGSGEGAGATSDF